MLVIFESRACDSLVRRCLWATATLLAVAPLASYADNRPSPAEVKEKSDWLQSNFMSETKSPPFSFSLGAVRSAAFLRSCKRTATVQPLDSQRTKHVVTWKNLRTGLEVRSEIVDYRDFPAVEWTVYLRNTGSKDTPIVDSLQALDMSLQRKSAGSFKLKGIRGDWCTADSYEPFELELTPGITKGFAPPQSGKSSDGPEGWPYHNLQMSDRGLIIAVGWPGQWASTFSHKAEKSLRIQAGQQLTHCRLKPSEEIRTPLIALLFWQGKDYVRSQNLWRRWYLSHVLPTIDGKPLGPQLQIQVGGDQTAPVQKFLDAGIKPDICWRDAGGANTWYPSDDGPYSVGGNPPQPTLANTPWLNTGTWEVDPKKYPRGFKPFSDWVRARGMKFLLWFEPERVGDPNSWLGKNHPEWLLPATDTTVGAILDLGNPQALAWLIDHIDGMVKSQGLDWYREDMNGGGPLPTWRNNDAEDRQGITENFYVQGHLKFWDELKRRNPKLQIDSCASGGRRNDLESMRRAVPLLRSDFQFPDSQSGVFEANQCHTHGLSFWLPFQGTGVYRYDSYSFRSFYLPSFGMGGLSPENTEAQQQAYAECAKIAPSMLFGDYYPLTPYSLANDVWIGWQFDQPEAGEGCVQVFRRAENPTESMTFRLQGLDPKKQYQVENFDSEGVEVFSGSELMASGLKVKLQPLAAAVFRYELAAPPTGTTIELP